MVPVRILGNLVRVSSVFVMSDWILPYSSDVNVQTLFIKPHSRKEKKGQMLHFCISRTFPSDYRESASPAMKRTRAVSERDEEKEKLWKFYFKRLH